MRLYIQFHKTDSDILAKERVMNLIDLIRKALRNASRNGNGEFSEDFINMLLKMIEKGYLTPNQALFDFVIANLKVSDFKDGQAQIEFLPDTVIEVPQEDWDVLASYLWVSNPTSKFVSELIIINLPPLRDLIDQGNNYLLTKDLVERLLVNLGVIVEEDINEAELIGLLRDKATEFRDNSGKVLVREKGMNQTRLTILTQEVIDDESRILTEEEVTNTILFVSANLTHEAIVVNGCLCLWHTPENMQLRVREWANAHFRNHDYRKTDKMLRAYDTLLSVLNTKYS